MKSSASFLQAFQRLSIASSSSSSTAAAACSACSLSSSTAWPLPSAWARSATQPALTSPLRLHRPAPSAALLLQRTPARSFSATPAAAGSWLEPSINRKLRMMKGRPRVATGGSAKGTTVVWGDYGLRMRDHHRRISAKQLKTAEDTIKQRLRGQRYRLYKRVNCNIGVFVAGNEIRMGKGKGSFDHWAARVAVNRVVFELRGALHEQVARDALRLAGNKLPGQYEFVRKGDGPVVGITKLEDGVTLDELKRPRKPAAAPDAPDVAPSAAAGASGSAAEASA